MRYGKFSKLVHDFVKWVHKYTDDTRNGLNIGKTSNISINRQTNEYKILLITL